MSSKCGGKAKTLSRADGKVVAITGANAGIGYQTTKAINLAGAKVYLLCRNKDKTQAAIDQLIQEGCDGSRLIFLKCDLSSFKSIRECAQELLAQEKVIDVLINNAGIMNYPKYELTVDGHEMTWQSNHLGPFLLTELLLPALKLSQSGRIINVSSKLHKAYRKKIDLKKVDAESSFGTWDPYNRSKLANVLHARALSHRLQQEGISHLTVNSLHPGVIKTDLYKTSGGIVNALMRWVWKTPEEGAQTSIYLALSPEVEGVTAKYFSESALESESSYAADEKAAEELYQYSLRTTGDKS